jgi:hypothetical protein
MNNKVLSLVAGALSLTLAVASPALGHGGGGGGHGGGGGGHGGMGRGHFAGAPFAHAGSSPRLAFHGGFRHRVFDRHLHRFVFIGAPYAYAAYDSCWRRAWTPIGQQWVNVCGDYGDYGY